MLFRVINRCCAVTKNGLKCRNRNIFGNKYGLCHVHMTHHQTSQYYIDTNDDTCSICLNTIINPIQLKKCHHVFCNHCILEWITRDRSCPNCRTCVSNFEKRRSVIFGILFRKFLS
jgi:hypothetical protein